MAVRAGGGDPEPESERCAGARREGARRAGRRASCEHGRAAAENKKSKPPKQYNNNTLNKFTNIVSLVDQAKNSITPIRVDVAGRGARAHMLRHRAVFTQRGRSPRKAFSSVSLAVCYCGTIA
ncbi:unnamed protein product [Leptosia nina]|uniref:Uncharacterized protein n=1 Tax=Leptosia nina TaxID=320188 RepID=A0AAV1JID1_9NEOP